MADFWSTSSAALRESGMEEPSEAWVEQHLEVGTPDERRDVVVKVHKLAKEGAHANMDVARTGAWLQLHGGSVTEFEAAESMCGRGVGTACALWLWDAAQCAWV